MRYLEVRRHSFTKKDERRGRGSQLSQQGVSAARLVGAELGPIAYTAVSESPRTMETAIAMGFAVDDVLPLGSGYATVEVSHHDQWSWSQPFVHYLQLLDGGGPLGVFARTELELWRSAAARVADGRVALVVGHGGAIEPTLVAALPDADLETWGTPFSHLDGVRLTFDHERCVAIEFDRYRNPHDDRAA